MKKPDIAKRMARRTGVSQAEAADNSIASSARSFPTCVPERTPPCLGWVSLHKVPMGAWRFNGTRAAPVAEYSALEQLAQVVILGLAAGNVVEIDGLGSFVPDAVNGFRFEPRRLPQVFVAYVKEDAGQAERLSDALEAAGFSPWMDVRKLLPGQNWPRAIEAAIERSEERRVGK